MFLFHKINLSNIYRINSLLYEKYILFVILSSLQVYFLFYLIIGRTFCLRHFVFILYLPFEHLIIICNIFVVLPIKYHFIIAIMYLLSVL